MQAYLSEKVQEFINQHLNMDVRDLALKSNPFPELSWAEILNQIKSKQKAKTKLPEWFATPHILYPAALSSEQSSSEATATYKSSIIKDGTVFDITGGMGIDDYYLSKRNNKVIYCEMQEQLFAITLQNFQTLGANNIIGHLGDGIAHLASQHSKLEHIYIDPARRDQTQNKVFLLQDCTPNVLEHLDLFKEKGKHLWIKTSPLLDLSNTIQQLLQLAKIYIIAVNNEVKELLWHLDFEGDTNVAIQIHTIEIKGNKHEQWTAAWPDVQLHNYGMPQKYLYVPSSAMFKSGLFHAIAQDFQLFKLHLNTHLYTSDILIDFPGRTFEIIEIINYQKSNFKQIKGMQANVSVRNFPENTETLIKKHQLKNAGNLFAFFTTLQDDKKVIIIAQKAK